MLLVLFMIDGNGAYSVVHAIIPFDDGGEDCTVVLVPKTVSATAIFHSTVCDVGH